VFGAAALLQRCQWHKRENVLDYLPERHRATLRRKLQAAYEHPTYEAAKRALGKVRRAFDVSVPAQAAALASLDDPDEIERRRRLNAEGLAQLEQLMRDHGLDPVTPSFTNFLFAEVGEDSRPLFQQLLREGVIVRPAGPFGAPGGIRVTVGTREENDIFAEALGKILTTA